MSELPIDPRSKGAARLGLRVVRGGKKPPTRRDVIRRAALGLTAFGVSSLPGPLAHEAAAAVHRLVNQEQEDDGYQPRAFLPHEWRLLRTLAEMILPADEISGSAVDAGAPEFIDLLASENPRLKRIFTSGMLWLEHESKRRFNANFTDAPLTERHALLGALADTIAPEDPGYPGYIESIEYAGFRDYTGETWSDDAHGVVFFGWLRRLVVDAFYTSPMGIKDVGYVGNTYVKDFEVPKESIRFAVDGSPFDDEPA